MPDIVGRRAALAAGALLAIALIAASAGACGDAPTATPCRGIPAGGCPIASHADGCEDPTCEAIYACEPDHSWQLVHRCPARDAAASTDATLSDGGDAGRVRDASSYVDVPGASGGPGCEPLEPPDCALATAAACPEGQCCGCEDLFVCSGGGWTAWGYCDADGGAIVMSR